MKCVFLLAVLAYGAHSLKSVGVSFGPKNCVMLSRSSAGSCVITTDCEGVDTTKLEFAFDCVGQSGNEDIVRHSFGVGGFEDSEEFDTEVKCGRCASASSMSAATPTVKKVKAVLKPVLAAPKPVAAAPVVPVVPVVPKKVHTEEIPGAMVFQAKTKTEAKTKMWPFTSSKAKKEEPEAVKYGPNNCVSVHKSSEGHCIMNTDCKKDDISNYEFGLVCVDKVGSPVKHLFGKDSFDAKESFDTLIKCDQCLGLEDVPDSVALAGEVATMGKEIAGLKAVLKNISINVQMLNTEVFPPKAAAPGPSPAAAAPAPAAAKDAVQLVSHQSISHHKRRGNLRRSHRHHHRHHRRDDDDDDDDEDREDEQYEEPETPVQYLEPSKPVQYYQAPPPVAPSVPASDVQQAANSMISATNAAADDDDEGSDED